MNITFDPGSFGQAAKRSIKRVNQLTIKQISNSLNKVSKSIKQPIPATEASVVPAVANAPTVNPTIPAIPEAIPRELTAMPTGLLLFTA